MRRNDDESWWDWAIAKSRIRKGLSDPITLNLWILILSTSAFGGFFVDAVTCSTASDGCNSKRLLIDIPCIVFFSLWALWLLQTDAQYVRPVLLGIRSAGDGGAAAQQKAIQQPHALFANIL